jgi:hypothetical protein
MTGIKKRYRKRELAERYSQSVRNSERMVKDGRLPLPDFYLGRIPFWSEETLDANDRAAAAAYRARSVKAARSVKVEGSVKAESSSARAKTRAVREVLPEEVA